MKKIYFLSIFCTMSCFSILSMDPPRLENVIVPIPENTEIYFDLDEVLVQGSWTVPIIVFTGLKKDPLNSIAYVQSLIALDTIYQKDPNGLKELLYDQGGNAIEGAAFHWLEHGRRDPNLTPYVHDLLKATERSRCFIPGTKKVCSYLKKKGYAINFATNKDRISYDLVADNLGYKFTTIPSKVFVAHPGNSDVFLKDLQRFAEQPTTHHCYQELTQQVFTIKQSDNIIHAPSRKPEEPYFQCLLNNSKNKEFVFFVDDNKRNIDGFNAMQNKTNSALRGIVFKNPHQLTRELVAYGILSEEADRKFLKKMGWK